MSPQNPSALIDEQIARTRRATTPRQSVFYAIWGGVWLASTVIALIAPTGWAAVIAIGGLWLAGAVGSGVYGARFGSGIHGGSRRTGQRIGATFAIALAWAIVAAVVISLRVPLESRVAVGVGIVLGALAITGLAVSRIGVLPIGLMLASIVLLVVSAPLALPLGSAVAAVTLLVEALRLRRAER